MTDVRAVQLLQLLPGRCPVTAGTVNGQPLPNAAAGLDSGAMTTTDTTVTLVSFGYLHGPAPEADHVHDVRQLLRDPARAKEAGILDMNGRSRRVREVVLHTQGAWELLEQLHALIEASTGPYTMAIGCAGGKHRAAALVEILADWVVGAGRPVTIVHRDIHRPRKLSDDAHSTAG